MLSVARRLTTVQQELKRLDASIKQRANLMPTAAHFLYIPGVLLIGIVIGWILGSRGKPTPMLLSSASTTEAKVLVLLTPNYQTPKYQPLPTRNSQLPTTLKKLELGVGDW